MFNHLKALAITQLKALDTHIRVVVIHPNYTQQHILLSELYGQQKDLLYVRFVGKKLNKTETEEQFEATLGSKAFLDGTCSNIVLDECDRLQPKALSRLVNDTLKRYPHCRIYIFSRELPYQVLSDADLRPKTAFIPHDPSFMLWDYAQREPEPTLLEVRSFGEGHVYLNGKRVTNWDGILPRSLFFYLVDKGMTTRNDIFETFWPNLTVREATNVFHVTKRKISEVLGLDLTTYWSGFYRVSSDVQLSYDVILFTEMLQNGAIAEGDEADSLLTRAIGLYEGNFLQTMEMEWAVKRRRELMQDYSDALISLAKIKAEKDQKQEALGLYLRALANNRHREDLTISIMQLYREQGRHHDALSAYKRLKDELSADLGVPPAQNVQALAAEIRQEMLQVS